jgi:hypothetical protein
MILKPTNRRPYLESAGLDKNLPVRERFTQHVFVESVVEPDPEFGDLRPQWAHMFKCEVTGAVRKFGVQEVVLS